ncbi:IS3 family transposase [Orbus sturtevantii]|uniref:IS3 family transposase n=1 Tax=Orbus sturtevantii TaxID=3074109 RepID=UPI00370D2395
MNKVKRERRTFTADFKQQMVNLYQHGKSRSELVAAYDLTPSALDRWITQATQSGSFKTKDNRSQEEKELIALRKELKQLRMENDIPKASRTDNGTKIDILKANRHRYRVVTLCQQLGISRHYAYYQCKANKQKSVVYYADKILTIFKRSYRAYGTRRIRLALQEDGIHVSRRYIARVMKWLLLTSKYTVKRYKAHYKEVNEATTANHLQREFDAGDKRQVIVADLTYIRVNQRWNYLCVLLNLSNRQISGYSVGKHKTADLVMSALSQIKQPLSSLNLFHSDRGKEFDNQLLDDCFKTFNIQRSLSKKGCPYDNAVAEATFKTIKTEFVKDEEFMTTTMLRQAFAAYAYWYNNKRLHSSLGYLPPVKFSKQVPLNFFV